VGSLLGLLNRIDRRILYLLVGLGCVFPLLFPLGLPIGTTDAVEALFRRVEETPPGSVVLISFDYGPSTAPENDPMADALMRHCLARGLRILAIALYPLGGVTELNEEFVRATGGWDAGTGELNAWPGRYYGRDCVNLGYKDGALAALRQMNESIQDVFPIDYYETPIDSIPLMQEVRTYADVAFAVSLATGIIGEWWANLVNAQFGLPVACGCTAVSAPKYFAYLKAGQMFALLGGLKGAAEYEQLVDGAYPVVRAMTVADPYYAAKGWDVQSIVYSIIIVFIVIGNVAYFAARRAGHAR
jgi:hypothetical protein